MGHDYAIHNQESLHPASDALADTLHRDGPASRKPARLCLPGLGGRSLRVRHLALWLSVAAHALLLGLLFSAGLNAPPPEPSPLIDLEFVEIPGPKGGGGSPLATPPATKAFAPAPRPRAVPVSDPAAKQAPAPVPAQAVDATTSPASGPGAANAGSTGGSGGGVGGGQGTGAGTATGSGVGQGGIAVDRMPVPVRTVKPRYPMSARRMGQSGQVLLRIHVDQDGTVREVTVVQADPPGVFENAAMDAVRKWRFSPALSRGAAVSMWMTLPVRFALDER